MDKDQNIWAGGFGGVSLLDGKSINTTYFRVPVQVGEIFQDRSGAMWFCSTLNGLWKYDGKSFTQFTRAQGLPDDDIRCIVQDKKGNLWIGTGLGISRFDGNKFENLSTTEGLNDNNVYDIIFDKEENMYISTNIGITILPATITSLPISKMREGMKHFSIEQGYPISGVWRKSMFCDSKGIIWIGTSNVEMPLIRFDPSSLPKQDSLPPSLVIKQVKIDEQHLSWSDLKPDKVIPAPEIENSIIMPANITEENLTFRRTLSEEEREHMRKQFGDIYFDSITSFYLLPVNLRLPQSHNTITIDFNATEVAYPNQVNYQYILEGYSKDWSLVSKNTSATFGNMREGKYTFKVKAQGPNGIWSEPVSYGFRVLPPWWRTWWAYTFYGLCLLAGIFFTDKIRRRIVVEKERTKARERELVQAKEIEKAYGELKATQAQLIQSEKMASLGELTAGIAHEIQNPLNFVNNFSEVNKELIAEMREEIQKGNYDEVTMIAKDIEDNQEKINHHGKRADSIVKGMLQHSRRSSGAKEPTDINSLADEYLRLSYHGLRAKDHGFNATIKTDFDESIGKINIVPQEIGRVILNLINNAFYAVNEKKKQMPTGYEPTVSVTTKKSSSKIELTVKDNGNGIPPKVLDKIFQPFFTTKPTGEGTGLGLSLSYDIVKAHGGELRVNTAEGKGSSFIIEFPVK